MKNTKSLKKLIFILFIVVALVSGVIFNSRLMATDLNGNMNNTTESSTKGNSENSENVEIIEPLSPEDSYVENKIDNVVLEELEMLQPASIATVECY